MIMIAAPFWVLGRGFHIGFCFTWCAIAFNVASGHAHQYTFQMLF